MNQRLILGGLALAACAAAPAQSAEYHAELGWSGRVSLAMPVSGVVEIVAAQPGQQLKKGELLAALNPTQFKAGVAEARAEVDRLSTELADARKELERVKELYARTVSATSELDTAQLRHDRAAAALAAAQARLDRARRLLEESELRAPFDAIVLARMAEPGLVAATPCQPTPLFTLARADELDAHATVSPDQASRLVPGRKAELIVGGRTIQGAIRGVTARDDGKFRLDVALPREPGLSPGQPVTIRLP